MKDKLGGKIMAKFVGLPAKSYLIDYGSEDKKENVCHKKNINLKIIKIVWKQTSLKIK